MRNPNNPFLLTALVAALALVLAAPAAAEAPTKETSTVTFGPFLDDETCSFPITVTVKRTRTTTSFADADIKRHTQLVVASSANGKTLIERDTFNVFIDADEPTVWVITGTFTHARLHGDGTIALQSGQVLYDVLADQVIDQHPGPHPNRLEDIVCDALSP